MMNTSSRSDTLTESFLPEERMDALVRETRVPEPAAVRDIVQKSLGKSRLELEELATLLRVRDPEQWEMIFEGARSLKEQVYGNRIVLFAPLYVGSACVNDCLYCGFRTGNRDAERLTLNTEDLHAEVRALLAEGHKRLILVCGEHPHYGPDFIAQSVRDVYAVQEKGSSIRRVNINAAPLTMEGFRKVHASGIGTYQIFQETYHRGAYARMHPKGPKADYLWRLYGLDRAMEAGIDDVGIGALFGLHPWRYELLGLLAHTIHLEECFGVGPHTISFPRLEPSLGSDVAAAPPHPVADVEFERLVAAIRLAVPYTGLILTAREPVPIRNRLLRFGVSQIDAGSRIGIGAYSQAARARQATVAGVPAQPMADATRVPDARSQFALGDARSLAEVIGELNRADCIPSFCTACYRKGRTGEHFMEFAIPGFVKRLCTPNAVLTFLEYLEDHAGPDARIQGKEQLNRELGRMPEGAVKDKLLQRMDRVRRGERDLYY